MRRLWIVVAVGVACACGDAFSPGHSRESLNLVPTFSENVYELLTGDLDQLHIKIARFPDSTNVVLDTTVGVDSSGNVNLDESVTLNNVIDSFTVLLQGIRSSDNTILYSGLDTVGVTAGTTNAPGDTIAITYVGPCPAAAGCTVTVAPQDSTLTQGDSLLMRVTVDSSGQNMLGVPVSVTNLTPTLVTVSSTRRVRALPGPGGPARVVAMIHGAVDTLRLTVTAAGFPVIGLGSKSIGFSGTQGGSNPAPQTVNITNTGIGSLTGLAQSITYVTGTPGWLGAGLSTATAPSVLTLTPVTGALTPGSYHARVTVSSTVPGVASDTVGVTFTVNAGAPALVIVTPGYAALRLLGAGSTAQLADTVKDGLGNLLNPSAATWTSRSPGVASVSVNGLVTATGRGIATIVATASAGVADSILVAVGDTTNHGDMLIFALTNGRAYGQRKMGQTAQVDFVASHAAVPTELLASYTIHYVWDQTVLRFDSVSAGTFTGALPAGLNTDSTANGVLIFADINANGAGGTPVLLHAYFTPLTTGSDAHSVQVTELSGSAPTYFNFYQLLQYLAVSGNAAISP